MSCKENSLSLVPGALLFLTLRAKGQLCKNFKRKTAISFLSIGLNLCFGCSKEPSHREGSFEYPQHMFWFRNKKIFSVTHSYLGPVRVLNLLQMGIVVRPAGV